MDHYQENNYPCVSTYMVEYQDKHTINIIHIHININYIQIINTSHNNTINHINKD